MKREGRKKFLAMLGSMADRKADPETAGIEMGYYYAGKGILPDSYPDGEKPDDDYFLIGSSYLEDGDRVLVIWTDAGELVAAKLYEA